jgi:hypothetical protein
MPADFSLPQYAPRARCNQALAILSVNTFQYVTPKFAKKSFTKAFKSVHGSLEKCSRREHFLNDFHQKLPFANWLKHIPMKKNEVF